MEFQYVATLDDGATYEVTADQRDVAHFEIQPFGAGWLEAVALRPFTFARFLSWSALKREKRITMTWDEWCDRCVNVDGAEDGEGGAKESDPGRPAASAGISSRSGSSGGRRSRTSK